MLVDFVAGRTSNFCESAHGDGVYIAEKFFELGILSGFVEVALEKIEDRFEGLEGEGRPVVVYIYAVDVVTIV